VKVKLEKWRFSNDGADMSAFPCELLKLCSFTFQFSA